MNEIYLVSGSTGEYSDHQEWQVAWFPTREEADEFADECKRLIPIDRHDMYSFKHPLDPYFQCNASTGTDYVVFPVPRVVWKSPSPPERR